MINPAIETLFPAVVTPSANRNSYRVASRVVFLPRVEVLRPSTLGCEIATPTELPGVRTVHGAFCLFTTTAWAYTNEPITSFYDGNIIIAKQISHNWFALSPLGESWKGAFQGALLKQQQL